MTFYDSVHSAFAHPSHIRLIFKIAFSDGFLKFSIHHKDPYYKSLRSNLKYRMWGLLACSAMLRPRCSVSHSPRYPFRVCNPQVMMDCSQIPPSIQGAHDFLLPFVFSQLSRLNNIYHHQSFALLIEPFLILGCSNLLVQPSCLNSSYLANTMLWTIVSLLRIILMEFFLINDSFFFDVEQITH